ncbi:MAG: serine/threonine protein kinase, partial [Planctomycetes bacterium]|nr:serine/threonine protein kinase [Planctomycetota bacterium]
MNTKKCPSEEDLFNYIVAESEKDTLDLTITKHLDGCSSCKLKYAEIQKMDECFSALPGENKDSGSLLENENNMIGLYSIVSLIGQGGMGKVYKAYDSSLNRHVAIKLINSELQGNPEFRSRFTSEAQIVAQLNHPNIVQIYSSHEEAEQLYLVMEYVDGVPLNHYPFVMNKGYLQHITLFRQILEGLKCAHDKGIVHRDIKPSNIMLGKDGRIRVLDFGLAQSSLSQVAHTVPGTFLGTVAYLSPERARGEKATFQSDIYSLGVVLFEMLIGELPFVSDTPLGTIDLIKNAVIPDVSKINSLIPTKLSMLISKMCHPNLGLRYNSIAEIISDLDEITKEMPSADCNYRQADAVSAANHDQLDTAIYRSVASDMNLNTSQIRATLNPQEDNEMSSENKKKKNTSLIIMGALLVLLILFVCFQFYINERKRPSEERVSPDLNVSQSASSRVSASSEKPLGQLSSPKQLSVDDYPFKTANLIKNGSNEYAVRDNIIPHWNLVNGVHWQQVNSSPFPKSGLAFFYAGISPVGTIEQLIPLPELSKQDYIIDFQGYVRSYADSERGDTCKIFVDFLENGVKKEGWTSKEICSIYDWHKIMCLKKLPYKTTHIRIRLVSRRVRGKNNNGYFDDLSLAIRSQKPIFASSKDKRYDVSFEYGDREFLFNDEVIIDSIVGDRPYIEKGGTYTLSGRYRLNSHSSCMLVLGSTSGNDDEILDRINAVRGTGKFSFTIKEQDLGKWHLSYFHKEKCVGGVYFGQAQNLLMDKEYSYTKNYSFSHDNLIKNPGNEAPLIDGRI